jgi:putative membrane protein
MAAGAVAGLVGTWAMNEVQRLWTNAVDDAPPESAGGRHDARDWQERSEDQNSNELAAQAIAGCLVGRRLTEEELRVAAPLAHYLFGAALGAIYGAYAERRRADASGAAFGTTVWLAADEIAMPLLGLSDSTARRPVEMHLQSLVAHLVYGTATEMTRRLVRAQFQEADRPRSRVAATSATNPSSSRSSSPVGRRGLS